VTGEAEDWRHDGGATMREILLDNFTLQGSYGFLHGHRTNLRELCLQILLESVVLYDRIYVPSDVLERNEPSRWVADQFTDVITGRSMRQTPDLHHHVVDMNKLGHYRNLLRDRNPFQVFDTEEAHSIELEGHPEHWSPPESMGAWGRYSFPERHLYYSWFCTMLAGELGLNYVPNPTRVDLFRDEAFRAKAGFPDLARDIIQRMEKVRAEQARSIQETFQSVVIPISLPMVYSFIMARSKDTTDFVEETIKLRRSHEACSYREYCQRLEISLQGGNRVPLMEARKDIEDLAVQWSRSLGKSKKKRKWQIAMLIPAGPSVGTEVETPFPNPFALDRKPQFVFVHRMLSGN
jgi:hypothetical protein